MQVLTEPSPDPDLLFWNRVLSTAKKTNGCVSEPLLHTIKVVNLLVPARLFSVLEYTRYLGLFPK